MTITTKFNAIRHVLTLTLVWLFCSLVTEAAVYPPQNSSYLDSVDYYLQRGPAYTSLVHNNINRQLDEINRLDTLDRLSALAAIGRRLEQIDIDSALMVYLQGENLALKARNQRYINKFKYRKGSVMPMMGLVHEGIETYSSVTPDQVNSEDKFDYFSTGQHIFDAAVDYYPVDSLKARYTMLSTVYNDSILKYVKPGSIESLYFSAAQKLRGNDRESGIKEMLTVLERTEIDDPMFAKAAAILASNYLSTNEIPKAKYYLAISAIGDLRAGTRETTSLHRLGKLLNNEEDYSRAYDYLTYALEAAVASGSNLRTIEIGEIMPAVVKASRQLEKQRNETLMLVIILLSVAVIVFVIILIYAFKTRNRLNRARGQLLEINKTKDIYIRKLITLCGAYLSALEHFNKLAGRKIKVGQINELLSMIESGKVIRDQLQSFYEVFDDTFLAVYPDFVEKVNELLLPDKQLSLSEDGRMGTELRIVAFMRLGLDDSAQIARLLGLSLNTIYTYRNKVKTRAIHREDFEEKIREIDS